MMILSSSELTRSLVLLMILELSLLMMLSRECLYTLLLSLLRKDASDAFLYIFGSLYALFSLECLKSHFSSRLMTSFCLRTIQPKVAISLSFSPALFSISARMALQLASSSVRDMISVCSLPFGDLAGSILSSSCLCSTSFLFSNCDLITFNFCQLRQLRKFSFSYTTSILGVSSLMQFLYLAATFSYQSTTGEVKVLRSYVLSLIEDLPLRANLGKGSSSMLLVMEDYISGIQQRMDQRLEWTDNKYEPGLFTFYMQDHSLSPPPPHKPRKNGHNQTNNRKLKSQVKIMPKFRLNNRYRCFNDTIAQQSLQPQLTNTATPHSFNRIGDDALKTERLSVGKTNHQRLMTTNEAGFARMANNTNINKLFHYDINRQRSKMFIYRGQPSNFVKKYSRKLNKSPQTTHRSKKTTYSSTWRIKTQHTITDNTKQSINSDQKSLSKTKERLNFLQFLIERNRQQQGRRADCNRQRIELTLSKLTQFHHPKMMEVTESFPKY